MEDCLNLVTFLSAHIGNIKTPSENRVHVGEVFTSLLHHFKMNSREPYVFHISTMQSGGLGQSVTHDTRPRRLPDSFLVLKSNLGKGQTSRSRPLEMYTGSTL